MKSFITGGAGFIGSNLVAALLQRGYSVTVYDNLSLGKEDFIKQYFDSPKFKFIEADLLDIDRLKKEICGHDVVFHMAANSDIAYGTKFTDVDLKQGTLATYNVLESMRINNVKEIVFGSTSTVYGEVKEFPIKEDYGPLFPISFYGASKLACEGLISAFCSNFGVKAWIFRFANIVGDNGTHGVLFDFINKLRKDSRQLEILGDGKQAKPYLYVKECIKGILFGYEHSKEQVNYFNLACNGATDVDTIACIIVEEMGLKDVKFIHIGGERGWIGDVPQVRLDPSKINRLGWKANYSSDGAVRLGVKALLKQI